MEDKVIGAKVLVSSYRVLLTTYVGKDIQAIETNKKSAETKINKACLYNIKCFGVIEVQVAW